MKSYVLEKVSTKVVADHAVVRDVMCPKQGILLDWVGVLVVQRRAADGDDPASVANSFEPFDPLWELLPSLAQRFKLCVVNNGPANTIPYFESRFGYSRFMEFVNSEIEGVEKPSPRIYEIACARIGLAPDQCLYMDDNRGFPAATEALGMEFIWWQTPEKGFRKFTDWLINHDNGVHIT